MATNQSGNGGLSKDGNNMNRPGQQAAQGMKDGQSMTCEQLMKRDVHCIGPGDSVQQAARLMRDKNIGFLPVCEADRHVIGTLTDRDITIRLVAENQPSSSTKIEQIMTRDVVSCRPQDTIQRIEELMTRYGKSRMIVCSDDGRLLGVISLSDIAGSSEGARVPGMMQNAGGREARH